MKIVSGGQTGVDRAALDVAMELGLETGGWCPAGRLAEDGPIPDRYPLAETPSADPAQRTEWNVRDSDGTLVLTGAGASPGTEWTLETVQRLGRPVYLRSAGSPADAGRFRRWLEVYDVRTLNVAGPRESESPGVYAAAAALLRALLA
ncbi:MAG TPA: putative molybdenum carrier protein [Longimicrobiaceae bacterium]|nr:putative molybdenum carrier protein [Longimicrobiaceae bacterium]